MKIGMQIEDPDSSCAMSNEEVDELRMLENAFKMGVLKNPAGFAILNRLRDKRERIVEATKDKPMSNTEPCGHSECKCDPMYSAMRADLEDKYRDKIMSLEAELAAKKEAGKLAIASMEYLTLELAAARQDCETESKKVEWWKNRWKNEADQSEAKLSDLIWNARHVARTIISMHILGNILETDAIEASHRILKITEEP